MHGICPALADGHLLRHAVDEALVILADRASEDYPIAFFVADALVFYLLTLIGYWVSHSMKDLQVHSPVCLAWEAGAREAALKITNAVLANSLPSKR